MRLIIKREGGKFIVEGIDVNIINLSFALSQEGFFNVLVDLEPKKQDEQKALNISL